MVRKFMTSILLAGCVQFGYAQSVEVDVNVNIEHSVGGISDFGRERHITAHSNLFENDWEGELEKANQLLNDLDVSLGRDNGTASFLFRFTPASETEPNTFHEDSLTIVLDFWREEYQRRLEDRGFSALKSKTGSMIMGTNPHPTFPTLSYNHPSGSVWGKANGKIWIPQNIETSASWMVEYLDQFFVDNLSEDGQVLPEYWEVVNEPDFLLNTGKFMMSSWEDIWEYHNLVAEGIKGRLGNRAPKIGGMTWGSHDLFGMDAISRFKTPSYVNSFYGNTPADEVAKAYARSQVTSPFLGQNAEWFQWDVMWKGFIDAAGENMDFYAVHFYDWPGYNSAGSGITRSGGHVEATLEMLESYDISKFGTRKPVVISEYGAVNNEWDFIPHDTRYDWESLKPFSAMLMQFLERPDYIELTMPFTPIKATWGDNAQAPYHYKLMRDDDGDGNWEWSDYIKWFQLWSEVDGTRVDTKASDPDIQVDAYVDGNDLFLILNNLEPREKSVNLNFFGNSPNLSGVTSKHLYLSGVRDIILDETSFNSAPSSVTISAEATMVLKYSYAGNVNVNQNSVEKKFYGESVGPGERVEIKNGDNTFFVNGVTPPSNPGQAEAMLKVTVNLFDAPDDELGFLSINKFTFNGVEVETPLDWRGDLQKRSRWFGVLEIPVPANLIQTNNTITLDFRHVGQVCIVNLVTWEFDTVPGRSTPITDPGTVDVTGVNISPNAVSLQVNRTSTLSATISPANASNKNVTWSSNNTAVATVSATGVVTANAQGTATITATTVDGGFTANSSVTVTTVPVGGGTPFVIEAEDLSSTSGNFDDAFAGGPGLGANITSSGVNYVNSGDWMEYEVNVATAGTYLIEYMISTPSDQAQVQFLVDGNLASTTNVPNNGGWESYTALSGGTINLSAGPHIIRIVASGSNDWQWNLDKINMKVPASSSRLTTSSDTAIKKKISIYPNPTENIIIFGGDKKLIEKVNIYDIQGVEVMTFSESGSFIDVSNLPSGVYTLQLEGEELYEMHRIIIK